MATKPMTDYQRFMHTLNRVAGPPHVRVKSEHPGTTYEANTTVEKWWCPSCRKPKALQLEYPLWLPYPKPHCAHCSDIEVYETLGLQELAFRGDSPPLVMCTLAKSYRHKTGKWPVIGTAAGQWPGACRKCDGCRAFTTQKQAHELSVTWAAQLAGAAAQFDHPGVWVIEVPESDKRRMLDALKYRIDQDGGALAQVPVDGGRVIFAVVGSPWHGRTTPLLQRLAREGERLVERTRTQEEFAFGWTVIIDIDEQTEQRVYAALMRRVWEIDGRTAKLSFRDAKPPTRATGTPQD